MRIRLNGGDFVVPADSTVQELLPDPTGHAVALNGAVVPRALHASTRLREGDVVEIVTAVQGG